MSTCFRDFFFKLQSFRQRKNPKENTRKFSVHEFSSKVFHAVDSLNYSRYWEHYVQIKVVMSIHNSNPFFKEGEWMLCVSLGVGNPLDYKKDAEISRLMFLIFSEKLSHRLIFFLFQNFWTEKSFLVITVSGQSNGIARRKKANKFS